MKFIGLIGDNLDTDEILNKENKDILLFDIDNTLYKEKKDLIIKRRSAGYELLKDDLNISFDEFYRLSDEYTNKYGTNYKGFITNHTVQPSNIRKINDTDADLRDYFSKNERLISILKSVSFKIACFTNSNLGQAKNTLINIGLEDVIDYVFYVKYDPDEKILCKPSLRAYDVVDKAINNKKQNKVLFFDDSPNNIETANQFGWIGVKVDDYNFLCEDIIKALNDHFNYKVKE